MLLCPQDGYSDQCEIWFKSNFVLATGPIAFAIVAWKNSLVFHSIDKVTSFALHIMPGLACYLLRWDPRMKDLASLPQDGLTSLTWSEQFLYPLAFYLTWQCLYLYIQFTIIEKDKTLVTSLRHLAQDYKNPATKVGYRMAVALGFSEPGEPLNPYKPSIIFMFTLFQLVFMTVCLIPTRLMYNYELINAFYLIFVISWAVFNGGSFYIQIFSQRYNAKFSAAADKTNDNGNLHWSSVWNSDDSKCD